MRDLGLRQQIKAAFEQAHAEAAAQFEGEQRATTEASSSRAPRGAAQGHLRHLRSRPPVSAVIGRTQHPEMDLYSSVCAVQNLWRPRASKAGRRRVSIIDHAALADS